MAGCDCTWEKNDQRFQRTRSQLSNALIELILERGWESVGVRELCARAGVARSTFYLHYQNKDELLEDGFRGLRETIRAGSPSHTFRQTGRFGFVEGVAAHIFENRKLFLALVGGNGGGVVRERFRMTLFKLIEEELGRPTRSSQAEAHFLAGGFIALAAFHMARKADSAQEFMDAFQAYAGAVMRKAA